MIQQLVRRGLAVLTGTAMLASALPAFAETNFITDGTRLLSPNSVIEADTSWRIDTSEVGHATYEQIEPDFVGPTDTGAETDGWVVSFEDDVDDDFLGVPLGFETSFNGEQYDRAYIQSNTYFTFGRGSRQYSDIAFDYPDIPGVHACSEDHSYQRVMYMQGEGQTRVRYEGTNSTSGELDAPNIVYEVVFYEGTSYVDLHIGINDGCEEETLSPEIRGVERTGFTLTASSGTWRTENELDITYQWQRFEGDWVDIEGATASKYSLEAEDEEFVFRVAVTADDGDVESTNYSDETDTIEPPVQVSTCEELMAADDEASDEEVIVLTDNIDCGETEVGPLAFGEDGFRGVFDGQGYEISNVSMEGEENIALFSVITAGARIQNFTATNFNINGGNNVGTIVGEVDMIDGGDVRITNVSISDSSVIASAYAGGVVGYWYMDSDYDSASLIDEVVVDNVTVESDGGSAGGLIGAYYDDGGALWIEDSSFDGDVFIPSLTQGVGGVIGDAQTYGWLNINRVSVRGTIGNGDGDNAGGLVGYLRVTADNIGAVQGLFIEDSYVNADISNDADAGGLIGEADLEEGDGISTLDIRRTYAAGSVATDSDIGGFIGFVAHFIEPSMLTISDSFSDMELNPNEETAVGGLAGYTDTGEGGVAPDVAGGFFFSVTKADTSSCDAPENIEGCTGIDDVEDPGYFIDVENVPMDDWDFNNVWWQLSEDYAVLRPATEPEVTTDDAETSTTTALASGVLEGDDGGLIIEYGFEYGATTDYGFSASTQSEGAELDDFDRSLTDLECNTTYHFRAFAVNDDGTGYGDDQTFETASCSSGGSGGGGGGRASSVLSRNVTEPVVTEPTSEPVGDTEGAGSTEGATWDAAEDRYAAPGSGTFGPSPYNGLEEEISVVSSGWFIRAYGYSTVYYIDQAHVRHVFWDTNTFFTWANSWDNVVWVTNATLQTLPLGTPMVPKPGVVLVKIVSDPTVYAISKGTTKPILHAVPSEATAVALYGSNWSDYVIDIDVTTMPWFDDGEDMNTSSIVDLLIMKTRAQILALGASE